MKLSKALRAENSATIAFAGAGGKTSAMFQLARQLPPPVIVTTTTRLGAWQAGAADHHIVAGSQPELKNALHELNGVTLISGGVDGEKISALDPASLEWLRAEHPNIPLLVEADGSRTLPLKAPAAHEPAIPDFADAVVQVAGLSGLGTPLNADHVHRPDIFSHLSGSALGEPISIEAIGRVLLHPEGGLKNIPRHARCIALLNQADTSELQAAGGKIARTLLTEYDSALVASLNQNQVLSAHEKVAGIVLAAGGSQRYGRPKQLLDWRGEPFVRVAAKTALAAGLSPVVVVVGAQSEQVTASIQDLPVRIVHNEEWTEGQASSIRAGVSAIADDVHGPGAAIFLLVDQPQITAAVLNGLVDEHARELHEIVAPYVMDRRANPVLFDRNCLDDLLTLTGDVGGRALMSKYKPYYLPWHDDRLLLDVDTPEQYARLLADDTL